MSRELRESFEGDQIKVGDTRTLARIRNMLQGQFNLLVTFLVMMSILLTVVGGLGLMGTMSINVIERTREIGVLRAIGASGRQVTKIVVMESVLIGVISWGLGTVLGLPLGRFLSNSVGIAFTQSPLTYRFSWVGVVIWLAVVVVISVLASLLPAWRAVRLTVRDVLSYQ